MLVLLSVAHTPKAPGARTPSGLTENEFSAAVCAVAAARLRVAGVRVEVFDDTITESVRVANIRAAEAKGAAILVEPHLNAAAYPAPPMPDTFEPGRPESARAKAWSKANPEKPRPDRGGALVGYWVGSTKGKALAQSLMESIRRGFRDARFDAYKHLGAHPVPGPWFRHADLPILSQTTCPAVITETAFVTNPTEAAFLEAPGAADLVGAWHAAGILDYLGRS